MKTGPHHVYRTSWKRELFPNNDFVRERRTNDDKFMYELDIRNKSYIENRTYSNLSLLKTYSLFSIWSSPLYLLTRNVFVSIIYPIPLLFIL